MKNKKCKTRWISMMLCMLFVLALAPATAMAVEPVEEAAAEEVVQQPVEAEVGAAEVDAVEEFAEQPQVEQQEDDAFMQVIRDFFAKHAPNDVSRLKGLKFLAEANADGHGTGLKVRVYGSDYYEQICLDTKTKEFIIISTRGEVPVFSGPAKDPKEVIKMFEPNFFARGAKAMVYQVSTQDPKMKDYWYWQRQDANTFTGRNGRVLTDAAGKAHYIHINYPTYYTAPTPDYPPIGPVKNTKR